MAENDDDDSDDGDIDGDDDTNYDDEAKKRMNIISNANINIYRSDDWNIRVCLVITIIKQWWSDTNEKNKKTKVVVRENELTRLQWRLNYDN